MIALLGLGSTALSESPRQWRDIKKNCEGSFEIEKEMKAQGRERACPQYDHCLTFIRDFLKECDSLPIAGASYCKVIPFLNIAQFYEEFKAHWQITNDEYDECSAPSYNRFRAAHLSFGTNIRLMRCKGNFSTCELCLNAAEMLRSKKYNKIERRLILDYRRQHLIQQARQREALDEEKLNSLELESQGQPLQCLFFCDAITTTRGDIPYRGKHKSKAHDNEKKIQNRTIGVELYCGPIKTILLYHTDEFSMGHGANIMIEVQRQALKDCAELLHERGLLMPKKAHFQFDNSGENKVRAMIM